jgi:hypothetical protein
LKNSSINAVILHPSSPSHINPLQKLALNNSSQDLRSSSGDMSARVACSPPSAAAAAAGNMTTGTSMLLEEFPSGSPPANNHATTSFIYGAGLRRSENNNVVNRTCAAPPPPPPIRQCVSRCLFGPPDPRSGQFAREKVKQLLQQDIKKWDFDFINDKPLEGAKR